MRPHGRTAIVTDIVGLERGFEKLLKRRKTGGRFLEGGVNMRVEKLTESSDKTIVGKGKNRRVPKT